MGLRKFSRRREAVTPIVADIIIVFITVAAFSLLYAVLAQWMSIQRTNEMLLIRERLIIEDAWFLSPPNDHVVRLVITNVGDVDAEVKYIKVNGVEVWSSHGGGLVKVDVGSSVSINVTLASPWSPNEEYEISIITARGNEFENVFWSPA